MTYENFTIKAQDAILKAQQMATDLEQQVVDTCHLCRAIIDTDEKLNGIFIGENGGLDPKNKI